MFRVVPGCSDVVAQDPDILKQLCRNDEYSRARAMIRQTPAGQMLKDYIDGFEIAEIAKKHGCKTRKVSYSINNTIEALRRKWGKYE